MAAFPITVLFILHLSLINAAVDFVGSFDVRNKNVTVTPIRCQAIRVPFCNGHVPYTRIVLPNILGHRKQSDVGLELQQFYPIVKWNCSSKLREFLCGVYLPECRKGHRSNIRILPCRELCEAAKSGCQVMLAKFGFIWPESLDCRRLPTSGVCYNGHVTPDLYPPTDHMSIRTNKNSCETIHTPMCMDISYNTTQFPNMLGHQRQSDASLEVHQYFPLVKLGCSPHLKTFLCHVYLPPCNGNQKRTRPCRPLCEAAKSGCQQLMKNYGFHWPERLNCDQFPSSGQCSLGDIQDLVETTTSTEMTQKRKIEIAAKTTMTSGLEDRDKPTDCVLGNFRCRRATTRVYINDQTMCCFDHKHISYTSKCDDNKTHVSLCKCKYARPRDVPGSC